MDNIIIFIGQKNFEKDASERSDSETGRQKSRRADADGYSVPSTLYILRDIKP